mmetsp:Transcript_49438/g.152515  ORF Transcript_49438/g.152515 Transcript_49438/m.152515 type:complete len:217 (+) Transcript_49438:431-1081(+)
MSVLASLTLGPASMRASMAWERASKQASQALEQAPMPPPLEQTLASMLASLALGLTSMLVPLALEPAPRQATLALTTVFSVLAMPFLSSGALPMVSLLPTTSVLVRPLSSTWTLSMMSSPTGFSVWVMPLSSSMMSGLSLARALVLECLPKSALVSALASVPLASFSLCPQSAMMESKQRSHEIWVACRFRLKVASSRRSCLRWPEEGPKALQRLA